MSLTFADICVSRSLSPQTCQDQGHKAHRGHRGRHYGTCRIHPCYERFLYTILHTYLSVFGLVSSELDLSGASVPSQSHPVDRFSTSSFALVDEMLSPNFHI